MAVKYVNAAMETDGDGSGPENAFKSISRSKANYGAPSGRIKSIIHLFSNT